MKPEPETTTRDRLIAEGARLVHRQGYNHTGIQEVVKAAGVPKGSFYFYFPSKKEFGLALVDHFDGIIRKVTARALADPEAPPLARLRAFFETFVKWYEKAGWRDGCPIGNLSQELADLDEDFRARLARVNAETEEVFASLIREAQARGEAARDIDPAAAARFLLMAWQGSLTRMKVEKSPEPVENFLKMAFQRILCP